MIIGIIVYLSPFNWYIFLFYNILFLLYSVDQKYKIYLRTIITIFMKNKFKKSFFEK